MSFIQWNGWNDAITALIYSLDYPFATPYDGRSPQRNTEQSMSSDTDKSLLESEFLYSVSDFISTETQFPISKWFRGTPWRFTYVMAQKLSADLQLDV